MGVVALVKSGKLFASALLAFSSVLIAQSYSSLRDSSSQDFTDEYGTPGGSHTAVAPVAPVTSTPTAPHFSKMAFGGGISPLGIQLSMTTNLSQHFNLRSTGNVFAYSTNFTTSGIGADARMQMRSVGGSLDIYPFHKGFRLSPGLLFYNGNQITANASVTAGTSFTLNGQTYYSANANSATGATPVHGNAQLSLHTSSPAFSITTGWGNNIPNKGHWSFPFEVGVAMTGAPSLNVNLGGWACYDAAQTICTDISSKTDPIALDIRNNLSTQVAKWTRDIEPLKTFPIASFGVAYSFGLRNR
jgi:hypothetical protein